MTFQKGQWVKVNWERVYPPLKGQVLKQSGEVTTVVIPTMGTIDFPTSSISKTKEPKQKYS